MQTAFETVTDTQLQAFTQPAKPLAKKSVCRRETSLNRRNKQRTHYSQTSPLTLSSRHCFFSHCLWRPRCLRCALSLSVTAFHLAFLRDVLGVPACRCTDMKERPFPWFSLCIP